MKYILPFLALLATPAQSDPPVIEAVKPSHSEAGWRFDVTLRHPDTGWDHYADAWEVISPDGTVLGTRLLAHPHVDEQPFSRSLGGISVPDGVDIVQIRARCSVDGWANAPFSVALSN